MAHDMGRNWPEVWSLHTRVFQHCNLLPVVAEAVVHLLEDGVLGQVPAGLLSHDVGHGLHVLQEVLHLLPGAEDQAAGSEADAWVAT